MTEFPAEVAVSGVKSTFGGGEALAGVVCNQNAAPLHASATGCGRLRRGRDFRTSIIGKIACALISSVVRIIGEVRDKAAGIRRGASRDTARRGVDRMRSTVLPAGKIIPAELIGRCPIQRIVLLGGGVGVRSGQMKFAEQAVDISRLLEQLGRGRLIG